MGGLHTPGKVLRDAREHRGYSVKELAAITRISPRLIDALETDDYTDFPAEVFVRGFLRNCARELDLDADSLVDLYLQHQGLEPATRPVDESADGDAAVGSIEDLFAAAKLPRLSYFFAILAIILGLGLSVVIFGQPDAQQLTDGDEAVEIQDESSP